jgi:LytS/YehU family sensor histidine kinase
MQRQGLARILGWKRVCFTLGTSVLLGLLLSPVRKPGTLLVMTRAVLLGLLAMLVFGLFEQWPKRLPAWLARWALQISGVALAIPLGVFAISLLSPDPGAPPFWYRHRVQGFGYLFFLGLLVAPWLAMAALLRQINGVARSQALAFELERSEFERRALGARLRLVQAQVEPHFLFNTLANVRELVDTGSPRASVVLGSLIAYLRAAVPRLHQPAATMGQELELVRAYLEVMQMRMPDRLQFTLHADAEALMLSCPPTTLLTLVENAVRHGIDPSEEGGRIEVRVRVGEERCRAEVVDTGVGLRAAGKGPGTGLSNLQERLRLAFGGDARLQLLSLEPHGVRAELIFPARRSVA